MHLIEDEKSILDGSQGEAAQIAMKILVDLGEIFGADEMMSITQVHIDTTIYMVDAGVEFAERMAEMGGRFSVPTQLNPSAIDLKRWKELRVDSELLEKSRRIERAYLKMGAMPTWTCAPYQQGLIPKFGEQIAWGESNAIAFANSVIGARTNRYADLMDICAGIIGKVPRFGLHLSENRKAEILITLDGFTDEMFADRAIYPLLGFVFGEIAADRIAALEGVPSDVSIDSLKAFSAAAASSGAVGLFHIIGVTPEAQTLKMCSQEEPLERFEITPAMLRNAEERLSDNAIDGPDLIVLGCPHFSVEEFVLLDQLLKGRKIHDSITCWVTTSRAVYAMIEANGILKELQLSGIDVFTDGCPLQYPLGNWAFRSAMSDSGKFVNYCYSQTGLKVAYGSLDECVETAVAGKFCRERAL
ncbi:MAG: aconitase X catalytic domain-containing protein [Deltaproteobacteria bacterium]|nr:aconitase X catalytic domain-containing protein [Deltaproteobacteria bacterium]